MMHSGYINIGSICMTEELLNQYTDAVGALPGFFGNSIPNMLIISRSIAMMLETFGIKDGAIHSTQEISNYDTVDFGEVVNCYTQKGKSRIMKDIEMIFVSCKFETQKAKIICESRSVVIVQQDA